MHGATVVHLLSAGTVRQRKKTFWTNATALSKLSASLPQHPLQMWTGGPARDRNYLPHSQQEKNKRVEHLKHRRRSVFSSSCAETLWKNMQPACASHVEVLSASAKPGLKPRNGLCQNKLGEQLFVFYHYINKKPMRVNDNSTLWTLCLQPLLRGKFHQLRGPLESLTSLRANAETQTPTGPKARTYSPRRFHVLRWYHMVFES